MRKHIILPFILLAILIFLTCDDNNVTENEPENIESSLTGNVILPEESDIDYNDITISLGDKEVDINEDLTFGIDGNEGNTGIIFASISDSIPFLLGTIPKIENDDAIELNSHSTALSLAFLSPFICTSDPEQADFIVTEIKKLPEYNTLANYIQTRLKVNVNYLSEEDETLNQHLGDLIIALINSVASSEVNLHRMNLLAKVNELVILPLTKSGHSINYKEANKFEITNGRGRWAYVVTSENNEFFIPPNGSLLDVISFNPSMWAPSKTEFTLTVPEGDDTARVNVYGFGWNKFKYLQNDSPFQGLTDQEIKYVHYGGATTILIELIPHTISTILNLNKYQASIAGQESWFDDKSWVDLVKTIANMCRDEGKVIHYLRTDNYWGMMWYFTKKTLSHIVNNDNAREVYFKKIGLNLSTLALNNLGKFNHVVLKPIFLSQSLTNAAKTWIAVYNCDTKAAFKIYDYKDIEFGTVEGTVHEENGELIEGATVILITEDIDGKETALTQVTGSDGAFRFENVIAGDRVLTVSKDGYTSVSVGINVTGGSEIDKTITLSKESGSVSGKIINEIFQKHDVSPDLFDEECTLTVKDLSDLSNSNQYSAYDGEYQLNLSPGEYRIIADHENYYSDSTSIKVELNKETIVDDLILKPESIFNVEIWVDINNDGIRDADIIIKNEFSSAEYKYENDLCPEGGEQGNLISFGVFHTTPYIEGIEIEVNPEFVTEPGTYKLGGDDVIGCSGSNTPASLEFVTTRYKCKVPDTQGDGADMVFQVEEYTIQTHPECSCGIMDFGEIKFTSIGTELGDLIEGWIFDAVLPGYTTCICEEDFGNLIMGCARATIPVIEFKILVGHDYDYE